MCNRPITQDGKTFACRTCDECIATRRHNWVARAMMEKAMHSHCLVLALTYDDSTQHNRDAARMFQYLDVRLFLARLREAIKTAKSPSGVRFICAGEQGDRNGRCHWHIILYSSVDLTAIGEVQGLKNHQRVVLTDRSDMISVGKRIRRLNWSLWPHGYTTFQEPDQGGMNYVLSYCLKDQFTVEKSRGTGREAKTENFATGLFRMSKRPAIGELYLYERLSELEAKGAVLPSLNIMVPGFHGYYHPSGSFRQKALWALVALNQRVVWGTGKPAPQWTSLLSSLKDNQPDLEVLTNVKAQETETAGDFAARIELVSREYTRRNRIAKTRRKCGSSLPCDRCLDCLTDQKIETLAVCREKADFAAGFSWVYRAAPGSVSVYTRQRTDFGSINPYCRRSTTKHVKEAFPSSGGSLWETDGGKG